MGMEGDNFWMEVIASVALVVLCLILIVAAIVRWYLLMGSDAIAVPEYMLDPTRETNLTIRHKPPVPEPQESGSVASIDNKVGGVPKDKTLFAKGELMFNKPLHPAYISRSYILSTQKMDDP